MSRSQQYALGDRVRVTATGEDGRIVDIHVAAPVHYLVALEGQWWGHDRRPVTRWLADRELAPREGSDRIDSEGGGEETP